MFVRSFFIFFCIFTVITSLQANEYSPAVGKNYPDKLLWGDTHLHTNESADAWSIGNPNLTPSDAFRFARGEEVTSESGVRAKLRVPLDFLWFQIMQLILVFLKELKLVMKILLKGL